MKKGTLDLEAAYRDAKQFTSLKGKPKQKLVLPNPSTHIVTRASTFLANNQTVQNIVSKHYNVKK